MVRIPAATIRPIPAIEPPVKPGGIAPVAAPAPAPSPEPASEPRPPAPETTTQAVPQTGAETGRHARLPSSNREAAGTTGIYRMDIDLYEGRVALLSRHGPPLRGHVSTDLYEGAYALTVDRTRKLWVISERVRPGLRFTVDLEGPDPFTLGYEEPVLLTVGTGRQSAMGDDSVRSVVKRLEDLRPAEAWTFLAGICDSLLFDVIDQLWSAEVAGQAVVMRLLTAFDEAIRAADEPDDVARVLRALESFCVQPEKLYVDSFSSCVVDPRSREPDPERAAPLSTLQLRLSYSHLVPERTMVVYADDILADSVPDPDPPTYGQGALRYPKWLSKTTTPRLFAAKKAVQDRLEYENIVHIIERSKDTFDKISAAWMIYGLAGPLTSAAAQWARTPAAVDMPGSVGAARLRGAPWRWAGIQPAEGGPGAWVGDFEGGTNMTAEHAWYQLHAAGTPPGWGYRCGGLQFENFLNGRLIDAKGWSFWGTVGRSMRGIGDSGPALEKVTQARSQLVVARRFGVGVEWRVASEELIPVIRKGFAAHGVQGVELVYVAPRPMPVRWTPNVPTRIR